MQFILVGWECELALTQTQAVILCVCCHVFQSGIYLYILQTCRLSKSSIELVTLYSFVLFLNGDVGKIRILQGQNTQALGLFGMQTRVAMAYIQYIYSM